MRPPSYLSVSNVELVAALRMPQRPIRWLKLIHWTAPLADGSEGQLEGSEGLPKGYEGQLERPESLLARPEGLSEGPDRGVSEPIREPVGGLLGPVGQTEPRNFPQIYSTVARER